MNPSISQYRTAGNVSLSLQRFEISLINIILIARYVVLVIVYFEQVPTKTYSAEQGLVDGRISKEDAICREVLCE